MTPGGGGSSAARSEALTASNSSAPLVVPSGKIVTGHACASASRRSAIWRAIHLRSVSATKIVWFKVNDRTSVVSGQRVSVRVDLGGRRISKPYNTRTNYSVQLFTSTPYDAS